ncbi:MAG: discoidin domain-containing protein [Patescibacteria group bacterium]
MKIIKTIITFFNNHYWLFLTLLVGISYGQLLLMFPWQDDHALFFKLANIDGAAGYLGSGIFGGGAYKYTASYYYLIYLLFGFKTIYYYTLSLFLYLIATLTVYKVIAKVVNEKGGRVAGFLFACGYVASDGIIRLYNSVGTSLSLILIALLLLSYWNINQQLKTKKVWSSLKWYVLAVGFYFLAVELIRYRTHYLISVVFVFEFLFLAFGRPLIKSFTSSVARFLPFGYIFYVYFVRGADSRTSQVTDLLKAVIGGDLAKLYSFFSSISNLIIPDWLAEIVFKLIPSGLHFTFNWILKTSYLSAGNLNKLVFLNGIFLVILLFWGIVKVGSQKRNWYLLFLFWLLVNLITYAAYQPTVAYETSNRFFAHSFFALSGLIAIVITDRQGDIKNKFLLFLVIGIGVGNLVNAVAWQRKIVETRSNPPRKFYQDLKAFVPTLKQGDIVYFDVAEDARQEFADTFSVAQMPEETAIAWNYGIDRYDIRRVTEYDDLVELLKASEFGDIHDKPIAVKDVYTFFYLPGKLIDTTTTSRKLLFAKDTRQLQERKVDNTKTNETVVVFDEPLSGLTPVEITLELSAKTADLNGLKFPYVSNALLLSNQVAKNTNLRQQAFAYNKQKSAFQKTTKLTTSSDWRENISTFLTDNTLATVWQADRVLWGQEGKEAVITLDMLKMTDIAGLAWINGYEAHSPTSYKIETSVDGKNWKQVKQVAQNKRIPAGQINLEKFSKQSARFMRFSMQSSVSGDSPGISEIWPVSAEFENLDIGLAEEFLANPFGFVPDKQAYVSTLVNLGNQVEIKYYWKTDKSKDWLSTENSFVLVNINNQSSVYKFVIPAGGTAIEKLKLKSTNVPVEMLFGRIWSRNLNYKGD